MARYWPRSFWRFYWNPWYSSWITKIIRKLLLLIAVWVNALSEFLECLFSLNMRSNHWIQLTHPAWHWGVPRKGEMGQKGGEARESQVQRRTNEIAWSELQPASLVTRDLIRQSTPGDLICLRRWFAACNLSRARNDLCPTQTDESNTGVMKT